MKLLIRRALIPRNCYIGLAVKVIKGFMTRRSVSLLRRASELGVRWKTMDSLNQPNFWSDNPLIYSLICIAGRTLRVDFTSDVMTLRRNICIHRARLRFMRSVGLQSCHLNVMLGRLNVIYRPGPSLSHHTSMIFTFKMKLRKTHKNL